MGTYMDDNLTRLGKALHYAADTGSFDKRLVVQQADNVCLFGLGRFFEEAFIQQDVAKRFRVKYLSDNNRDKLKEISTRKDYENFICLPPEELKKLKNVVVIIMVGNSLEIEKQFRQMDIPYMTYNELALADMMNLPLDYTWFARQRQRIFHCYEILHDDVSKMVYVDLLCNKIAPQYAKLSYDNLFSEGEYFGHGLFSLDDHEVFIDCGAFTGDTIEKFIQIKQDKFHSIVAFELDQDNYEQLQSFISSKMSSVKNKIISYNFGVWSRSETIRYGRGGEHDPSEGYSVFKKENTTEGKVVKIDDIIECQKATFIKMDIEGAELPALYGAAGTIRKMKPKLAICLYHRLSDLWEIPLYIYKLHQDYKISIRHHHVSDVKGSIWENSWGTVCYAR